MTIFISFEYPGNCSAFLELLEFFPVACLEKEFGLSACQSGGGGAGS